MSVEWRVRYVRKKKNGDSKRKHKSGNMGTEEMEMSFREELWERKKVEN